MPEELLVPPHLPPWRDPDLVYRDDPRPLLYVEADAPTWAEVRRAVEARRRYRLAVANWAADLGLLNRWGRPLPEVWAAIRDARTAQDSTLKGSTS